MKSMLHLRQASMDCAAQAASNYQSLRSLGEESRKLCSLASNSRKWNRRNEFEDEYYDTVSIYILVVKINTGAWIEREG